MAVSSIFHGFRLNSESGCATIIEMQSKGRSVTGLHISPSNLRRHLQACLFCARLEAKKARRKSPPAPAPVVMFPNGKRAFRLHLVRSQPDGQHSPPQSA
jgi:hypothetical protein